MSKTFAFTLLALGLCLVLVPTPATALEYDLSVDVVEIEGGYELAAEVRALGSDTVLTAPRVQFPTGSPAKVTTQLPQGDTSVTIIAEVSADGAQLEYSLEIDTDGEVVARQRASIALN